MRRSFGVVHGLARCVDCGWEASSYKNAQATSARHAKATGHRVEGEIGAAFYYDGEGVPEKTRRPLKVRL